MSRLLPPMQAALANAVQALGDPGPILAHSDLMGAARAVVPTPRRVELLERHLDALDVIGDGRPVWHPTFHYGFCGSGLYDVATSPSEVGALSEHARTSRAQWRTATPIFSIAGSGPPPSAVALADSVDGAAAQTDVFGEECALAELARRSGIILMYGAPFSRLTYIHRAERAAGGPPYRYDKVFDGVVKAADGASRRVQAIYHVRPMGRPLDYDWTRLRADIESAGIARAVSDGLSHAVAISAAQLDAFWSERLARDPLYALDDASRGWVEPMLERLGRAFVIQDFESEGDVRS